MGKTGGSKRLTIPDGREFYTAKELAVKVGLSLRTVYRMAKTGDLPCHTFRGRKRFRIQDVEDFYESCITVR